jgi:hypothetical protein
LWMRATAEQCVWRTCFEDSLKREMEKESGDDRYRSGLSLDQRL